MADILGEHVGYLADRVKLARYQAAINRVVHSEHLVLDLGCGTGVLGLMALRAGARKVIFVEEEPVIEIARQTVAKAGFADRAGFFRLNSFELEPSERADVVICDHVGYFGFDYGILSLLADARQRFLKADGILMPVQIDLKLAPIESAECRKLVGQWQDGTVPNDYGWVRATAANTTYAIEATTEQLLADALPLATLELGADVAPFLSWSAEFKCARDGTLDGLAGWFDCGLFDDLRMTNSPTIADAVDRPQAFLPLVSPTAVSAGETIQVEVMVRHLDSIIAWIVKLPSSGRCFAHNTFNGLLLDRESLMRTSSNRLAKLNNRGQAHRVVLSYCDGKRTVAQVQALVQLEHPQLFPSALASASFVTHVLSRDTNG